MLKALAQRCHMLKGCVGILDELLTQRLEIVRNELAALIARHEFSELRALGLQQSGHIAYPGYFGTLQPVVHQSRAHVNASEEVTDIVQYAGCNFRHSSLASGGAQLIVYPLELELRAPPFRYVLSDHDRADEPAVCSQQAAAVGERHPFGETPRHDRELQVFHQFAA